jgi:5-methylcytosine-specific restriction endonuclease McrA
MQRESFISARDKYRGSKGKGNCGYCGKPITNKRRSYWCSDECTSKVDDESYDWQRWKHKTFFRDGYACRTCGDKFSIEKHCPRANYISEREYIWFAGQAASGYLDCDHVRPVELAPKKQWDLNNLQSLCHKCHKAKTKLDMAAIARHRRRSKRVKIDPYSKPLPARTDQSKLGDFQWTSSSD